jgi:hypothetical protein
MNTRGALYFIILAALTIVPGDVNGGAMFPVGIRLSNPGNLRHTDDKWVGMTRLQDDKKFVRFSAPKYGIRAMMKTMLSYDDVYGLNTVTRIVTRWAPPNENNTAAYIRSVSDKSGFSPNVILDVSNPKTLMALAEAITIHENGYPPDDMPPHWYEEATFHAAAMLALYGEE